MSDSPSVDELSLEELEAIVAARRRAEHERQLESDELRFRSARFVPDARTLKRRQPKKPLRLRDRILFLVEITAVLGLIAVIVTSLYNLQSLNQDVAQAKGGNATGANGYELPGSSYPPSSELSELPGSSSPPEPAPPALGVKLQKVAALPIPTPGPRSPSRIVISSIGVDWPIVPGDGWEELKQGIGHHVGSANPGERGNLILSGHNDVYGEPFRDLEKLDMGKDVLIYSGANAFHYVIRAKRVVAPSDLSALTPSRNPIITLITCTPYRVDTYRLILIGELQP
jgi:sortase A